jgi:hypothetical protein
MEWDIDKLADFLEREAQAGVAIEHKILEWKIAEEKVKTQHQKEAAPALIAEAS